MLKVNPHPDYPPEEGRNIRGNDFSPVAVAIILNCDEDKINKTIHKANNTAPFLPPHRSTNRRI